MAVLGGGEGNTEKGGWGGEGDGAGEVLAQVATFGSMSALIILVSMLVVTVVLVVTIVLKVTPRPRSSSRAACCQSPPQAWHLLDSSATPQGKEPDARWRPAARDAHTA
eukprot:733296-Hanusia_phi.AAC.5